MRCVREPPTASAGAPSREAKERILSRPGEPALVADWIDTLMVHLEVDPTALQQATPFPLDLFEERAFVSLVFFTMRRMRPARGGFFAEWLLRPISTHEFLNVRAYVRHGDETGICFLAEWLPNALSVRLGPAVFGLPYRLGRMTYRLAHNSTKPVEATVVDEPSRTRLACSGRFQSVNFVECADGSLDQWLMERYTAFTYCRGVSRFFRVWHPPWLQTTANVTAGDTSLLRANWPWMADAQLAGAHFSPGFDNVWMGRPHRI